jgi:hypothetical protein
MAEADGNRTRRMRLATHPIGFEVRGPHQRDNRFQLQSKEGIRLAHPRRGGARVKKLRSFALWRCTLVDGDRIHTRRRRPYLQSL